MFYIVNLTKNKIESVEKEKPRANYVLTDCYAPHPINKYTVMYLDQLNKWIKEIQKN